MRRRRSFKRKTRKRSVEFLRLYKVVHVACTLAPLLPRPNVDRRASNDRRFNQPGA